MEAFDPEILRLARLRRGPYLAALSAPKDKRPGLLAVLALDGEMARIPLTVSEPMLGRIRLQWWIDVMPGVVGGRAPSHPVAQALAPWSLDLATLRRMVEGYNFDLDEGPASVVELIEHARDSASACTDLMLSILGVTDEAVRASALDVVAASILVDRAKGGVRVASREDGDALCCQARIWLGEASARTLDPKHRRAALALLLQRRMAECLLNNPDDPLGAGAVLAVWWGSVVGRF